MIKREPRTAPAEEPEAPVALPDESPAVDRVELIDLDFNLGRDDTLMITLEPGDVLTIQPDMFVITKGHETIEIDRSRVRWRSTRTRTVTIPRSLDPADAHDAQ